MTCLKGPWLVRASKEQVIMFSLLVPTRKLDKYEPIYASDSDLYFCQIYMNLNFWPFFFISWGGWGLQFYPTTRAD